MPFWAHVSNLNVPLFLWQNLVQVVPAPTLEANWEAMFIASAKDGKGKKQQVVRALAETVKNPQTIAQMRGRMIMSTVMQAQSAMAYIVDHSFDGVPAGQPSISEFIRRNYELIKADVAAQSLKW